VKLERLVPKDGTLYVMRHGTLGPSSAPKPLDWSFRASREEGSGTLGETRRMCFFVLAEGFPPNANEVTVKVRGVKFEIRPQLAH